MTVTPQDHETPVSGVVVPAAQAALSPRDILASDWWQPDARAAAARFWLKSRTSPHTREAYERDLTAWFAWCDDHDVPVHDARRGDLDNWRDHISAHGLTDKSGGGLSPASLTRTLSAVSSFYTYWVTEGILERNPVKNVTRPRISQEPGSISLTERECNLIISRTAELAARGDLRPGVIVRLLAETGMRVSELCGARVTDLGISGGIPFLNVVRKGGKPQSLAIVAATRELIGAYLDGRTVGWLIETVPDRRKEPAPGRPVADGQVSRSYVRDLSRRLAKEAGLPEETVRRMSPHVFRHSAVTLLASYRVPPHEIAKLVGHAHLVSTERYIHFVGTLANSPTHVLAQRLAAGRSA